MITSAFDASIALAAFCGGSAAETAAVFGAYAVQAFFDDLPLLFIKFLAFLSIFNNLIAYRRHRKVFPVLLAIASGSAIIYGINAGIDTRFIFSGMIGLLAVSLLTTPRRERE